MRDQKNFKPESLKGLGSGVMSLGLSQNEMGVLQVMDMTLGIQIFPTLISGIIKHSAHQNVIWQILNTRLLTGKRLVLMKYLDGV
jgi:hypothetical protein